MDEAQSGMSRLFYIVDAGVEPGEKYSAVLWLSLVEGNATSRIRFYVEHPDMNIQQSGQSALSCLCHHLGMMNVADASEFIGKTIDLKALNEIYPYIRAHVALLDPPVKLAVCVPPCATPQQQPPSDDRYVYVISCAETPNPICKIGIAGSPEKRLKQLSTSSPHALRLEFSRFCHNARDVEAVSHVHFHAHRLNGEWFSLDHRTAISFVNDNIDRMAA